MNSNNREDFVSDANGVLADAAQRLKDVLAELASSLRPFPPFLGMVSLQAVELDPEVTPARDLGCVVVNPEGEICRLDLGEIAGIAGLTEAEQVEQFQPLELSTLEYIVYATAAINSLSDELRRRRGQV